MAAFAVNIVWLGVYVLRILLNAGTRCPLQGSGSQDVLLEGSHHLSVFIFRSRGVRNLSRTWVAFPSGSDPSIDSN